MVGIAYGREELLAGTGGYVSLEGAGVRWRSRGHAESCDGASQAALKGTSRERGCATCPREVGQRARVMGASTVEATGVIAFELIAVRARRSAVLEVCAV